MLKKFAIVIFSLGLILVILGFALTKGDFSKIKATFINEQDYEFKSVTGDESVTAVNIDVIDNNINFYKSVDETYKVDYYTSENDKINVSLLNGELEILGSYKRWFGFFNWKIKSAKVSQLDIYLPNSYNGGINVNLTSGTTTIEDFEISSLEIDITSGTLNIKDTKVLTNINFEITSGKIYATNVEISNLYGEATSGSITIKDSTINDTDLEVTSGNIKISNSEFDKLNVSATSGNITLSYVNANEIMTDITSGNTYMKLIGNKDDYKTKLDIVSGDIVYLGMKVKELDINPFALKHLKATGTSGDIEIEFVN